MRDHAVDGKSPYARLAALLLFVLAGSPASAQSESSLVLNRYRSIDDVASGSGDLGDFDGDGDLDFVVTGWNGVVANTSVYCHSWVVYTYQTQTTGEQVFFDTVSVFIDTESILTSITHSSAKWGDHDGDGDEDLIVSGLASTGTAGVVAPTTELYRAIDRALVRASDVQLTGVYAGENAWGDYDADGDLDLLSTGATATSPPYAPVTLLYENEGRNFRPVPTNLPGVAFSAAAWSDFDGDGDLDLALSGDTGGGVFLTDVFRNDGEGTFTPLKLGLPQVTLGSVDWGDLDGDGWEDLLITGGVLDPRIMRGELQIYRNRNGFFERMETNLPGVVLGSAKFADFNRDGKADIVVAGSPYTFAAPLFEAYEHLGGGDFRILAKPFGLTAADLTIGDFNHDGDIDVAGIGRSGDGQLHTLFYHNLIVPEKTEDYFELNPDDLRSLQIVPDLFGRWSGCYQNYSDR